MRLLTTTLPETSFLRRHLKPEGVFYCENRDEKRLPGGEVTRFAEYPWKDTDRILAGGQAPWTKFFFSVRTFQRGPRFLGLRVPFVNYFDGDISYRLAVLSPEP